MPFRCLSFLCLCLCCVGLCCVFVFAVSVYLVWVSLIWMMFSRCKQKKNPKKSQLSFPRSIRQPKNTQKTLHLVLEPQRGRLMLPSGTVSPSLVFKKMTQKNTWHIFVPPLDNSCSGTQVNQPVSKFNLINLNELRRDGYLVVVRFFL